LPASHALIRNILEVLHPIYSDGRADSLNRTDLASQQGLNGVPAYSMHGRLQQGCGSRASRDGFTASRVSNAPEGRRLSVPLRLARVRLPQCDPSAG
jgi:hypothetical protein